jgi:hypothetical protein
MRKPKGRKFRHLALANPALPDGGMFLLSKIAIADLLKRYNVPTPRFAIAKNGLVLADPDQAADARGRVFVKPEFGLRSIGLAEAPTFARALEMTAHRSGRYLLQPAIAGREYTVHFLRAADGRLSVRAMVERVRLTVVGDGRSTIGDLVRASGRGRPGFLAKKLGDEWSERLLAGERRTITRQGTHSFGARFKPMAPPPWALDLASKLDGAAGLDCFKLDLLRGEEGPAYAIDLNGANAEPLDAYAEPIDNRFFIDRVAQGLLEAIECGWRREQAGARLPSWNEMRRKSRHMLATLRRLKQA